MTETAVGLDRGAPEQQAGRAGAPHMLRAQRRLLELSLLYRHGAVTRREIVDRFGVSSMTAARDLEWLGHHPGTTRVWGGVLNDTAAGQPMSATIAR